ncbi:hypothetical protein [Streptomyces sp. TRM68367]|uniref:hypothetical protein n=1 Tax=Streptomyces sp. TRM68367 TaxID=2758415 RepID=UPI00165C6DF6|nr:hypothetical protein [Streptomyces sp. TRM68367]MBC9729377.1 hypothetical protein [Streptomyces sp. TRM68367]
MVDEDGPVNESDALLLLASGGQDAEERAEAERAASIADLIAARLREQTSGLSIRNLTVFNDSVSFSGGLAVGGARSRGGGKGAEGAGGGLVPIAEDVQDAHVENFVPPSRYLEILESLGERYLVVLAVAPGSGREATAVNLLAEALALHATDAPPGGCHRITDPAAVTGHGWSPPHKNAGYLLLLEDTAGEAARTLDLNWLTATGSALKEVRSFMVVVTGMPQGALARAADESSYVCVELGDVDLVAVVESHVLGPAPEAPAETRLRRALADSGAVDALHEQPRPEVAVRIAMALRAGRDLAAEVGRVRDPSEQVHQWFLRHEDPVDTCFALAAAVHEETGYLTVADAALKLHTAVAGTAPGAGTIRFAERLVHEQPWLTVAPPKGSTDAASQVRFRSPLLKQAVLSYAWTRLDGYRAPLIDWLRVSLWRDPDPEVRAKAAVAAGILAWNDPEHALHRFLRAWAGSKSVPIRQGAATALAVVAQRAELTAWVWEMLEQWVSTGGTAMDRRLAKTAATAVRGLLGRQDPRRALAMLAAALDWRDDWGNLAPVAWSAVHLIDNGQEREVLDAFLTWSAPQDVSPMVSKTLSAFLFTALQPYAGDDTPGPSAGRQPRLLSRARELQPELEELWARALARKPVQDRALEALRVWIDQYASRDRSAFESLRLLVRGIALRPGKHRQRLEYWLARWAADPARPSPAAARLLHTVRELP